jgi:hypothetical protein
MNKNDVRIPFPGCHWRSNYQKEGYNPINRCHWRSNYQKGDYDPISRLSFEVKLTKKRLGSHYSVIIGDQINKKKIRILLTDCNWRSN